MEKAVDIFMSIMAGLKCEDENTLSDTIWAMCMADKDFLQLFFVFMFDKKGGEEKAQSIIREVSAGAYGRNDFVIITDEGKYYVENKINDKNLNLEKYSNNEDIKNNNLAYIVNNVRLYKNVKKVNESYEINFIDRKILLKEWKNFANIIKVKYDYIRCFIERITNKFSIEENERTHFEKIYDEFIKNRINKKTRGKDNTWKKFKAYGRGYLEKNDKNRLFFYIKHTPEFGYMFLFGIENKFQNKINSWNIPFIFKECNPLGYYFHDYYSVYYVDVRDEIKEKKDEIVIKKLGKALEEMKKYVGIESISCSQ